MARGAVDNSELKRWRAMDALAVLEKLECHPKVDPTFEPVRAYETRRFHVSSETAEFELLLTGPKFYDTRRKKGGGGAVDLAMHMYATDFKGAVALLRQHRV